MRIRIFGTLALLGLLTAGPALAQEPDPDVRSWRVVPSAWIGVSFAGTSGGDGEVVVERVSPDAPAERAGIRPGDRIVRWNGRADVLAAIRGTRLQPGDTVLVRIRRAGEATDRDLSLVAEARATPFADFSGPERLEELMAEMSRHLEIHGDSLRSRANVVGELSRRLQLRADSLRPQLDSLRALLPRLRGEYIREWRRQMPLDSIVSSIDSLRARRDWPFTDGEPYLRYRRSLDPDLLPPGALSGPELADNLAALGRGMAVFMAGARNGVAGAELTELSSGLASYFGIDRGVLVLRVLPETPAARAGLREGDVIISVADRQIEDIRSLRRELSTGGDVPIELLVVRHGQRVSITLDR